MGFLAGSILKRPEAGIAEVSKLWSAASDACERVDLLDGHIFKGLFLAEVLKQRSAGSGIQQAHPRWSQVLEGTSYLT